MGNHERYSTENEWYIPKYIFDALEVWFDMDVCAAPKGYGCVPASTFLNDALNQNWEGFVWCNPPFAGRGTKQVWIDLMHRHGNGILLTPDRSSAPWWQDAANKCSSLLIVNGKIKFIPGIDNNSNWKQPGCGTTLFGFGGMADTAPVNASRNSLGILLISYINNIVLF